MRRPRDEALAWDEVTVVYGSRRALDRVSLTVHCGEALALVGPNGSGKSTLLRVAAGVQEPSGGRVLLRGLERRADPVRYARQVGWSPQQGGLYDELTVEENLQLFGRLQGFWGRELRRRVQQVMGQFGLGTRSQQRVGTLSGGWKQRVNVAAALIHGPAVVLLDEPTSGLDADSREHLLADLYRLREEGCAVVLATHQAEEVAAVCDRVVRLEEGRVVTEGEADPHSSTQERVVLYAQLRWPPPRFVLRQVRQRLSADVRMELVGRRLRVQADRSEDIGYALAELLREGVAFRSYRTVFVETA